MTLTRRDLLLGLSGSAVGAAFTPAPWKLLDDVSIWTQRRHVLPAPPRGPVAYRAAACTLCPGGCALRVRCVGARPVSVAPAAGHPLGAGACAVGLTLHHLAYHPLRLATPMRREPSGFVPLALDAAVASMARVASEARASRRSVLVLDRRPGRVASAAWREWLAALPGGRYATTSGEDATLTALGASAGTPFGIDLERARTVVSFGASVLDGWGRPGRVRAARAHLRVVQVDTWRSPSASLADEWIAIEPGAEGALALVLARLVATSAPGRLPPETLDALASFTPAAVAARSGVAAARIVALARELADNPPAVAIGGGDAGGGPLGRDVERAIAILDVALGSVGAAGGLVPRRPLPSGPEPHGAPALGLEDVPAGSVGLAILDGADDGRAVPWPAIARTLAPGALVVSLSPFDGPLARRAGLVIPAPAPLEALDEALPAADDLAGAYAVAPALLPKPEGATETVELVQRLAAATGVTVPLVSLDARLRSRAAALHASGRGRFVARAAREWSDATPDDAAAAWQVLAEGGVWLDAPPSAPPPATAVVVPLPPEHALRRWAAPAPGSDGLALVAFAGRGTAGTTPVSPVLTKLYQETALRPSTSHAVVHPVTAARIGLGDGQRVVVESPAGSAAATLRLDPSLPPGRIALAAGPERRALQPGAPARPDGALAVAELEADGTWRGTRVRVREA